MRRDRIVLGRDYRLRWSRSGLYRVRALSWRVQHGSRPGQRTRNLLRVEWREEDTGEPRPEVENELIEPAELIGPWDNDIEKAERERVEQLRSAVTALRDACASAGLGASNVHLRGGKVVLELDVTGGETLAHLIEKAS